MNASLQSSQLRSGKAINRNDLFAVGRNYEQNKQWNAAVEAYLSVKNSKSESPDNLAEIWERAVELSRSYLPNRYVEIATEVAKRLINLGREEAAATVLFDCGRNDEAITVLLDAKKFDKARTLAKGNALLKRRMDDAYQNHLVLREDSKELAEMGQTEVALDLLVKRGEWDRIWELLNREKVSVTVASKYILMKIEEVRCLLLLLVRLSTILLHFRVFVPSRMM